VTRRLAAVAALALGLPSPAAAGEAAPRPAQEALLAIGYGRYAIGQGVKGDAASQTYDIDEAMGYLGFTARAARGLWWQAEGGLGIGEATPLVAETGTVADDAYQGTLWTGVFAARAGWTARRWGAAAGPAVVGHPDFGGLQLRPSLEAWAGPSERLYVQGRVWAGPQTGARDMAATIGLGHRSSRVRASVDGGQAVLMGTLDLHLGVGLWLGAQYAARTAGADQEVPDQRTLLRLTVAYDELGRAGPPAGGDGAPPPP
jgi:hypothetical protein